MIKCPTCGKSHYTEGPTQMTAMYFPPIWENGVNTNPDRNIRTTECKCLECHHYFYIKACADEITIEAGPEYVPDPPPIKIDLTENSNCTIKEENYIPLNRSTAVATIDMETGEALRTKYKWEKDIEELWKEINRLQKEIWELQHPGEWYDY